MQVCLWQHHVGAPFGWRSCGLLATCFQFGPLGKTPDHQWWKLGKVDRHPYPWWRVWILQGRRIFRVVLELNFLHWRIHQGRSHESFPHRCDSWKMDEKISCYSPCFRFCALWFLTIVPIIWPEIKKTVYTLPHFFPAPKPQVRDEVHKHIAELTAWSMDFAGQGKWPHNGFQGEAFSAGTTRFKQRGKDLANGWRIPSPLLLQNLSVLLSSKWNGSCDVGIHGKPS